MIDALSTDQATLFALSSTAIITAITPGPNNFTVLAVASVYGKRKALPIYAAICLGVPLMLLSISLIMHILGDTFMPYMDTLRYFGMVFLLYIAFHIYIASSALSRQDVPPPSHWILENACFSMDQPQGLGRMRQHDFYCTQSLASSGSHLCRRDPPGSRRMVFCR